MIDGLYITTIELYLKLYLRRTVFKNEKCTREWGEKYKNVKILY